MNKNLTDLVVLSLGSNLGDRCENLEQAILLISQQCGNVLQISSTYETEPWGIADQPAFLNLVFSIQSFLTPEELMKEIIQIELQLGRTRASKWEQRIIDIDILYFGELISDNKSVTIPHPRIHERKFVLIPLAEILPDFVHPVLNNTSSELLYQCEDSLLVKKYVSRKSFQIPI